MKNINNRVYDEIHIDNLHVYANHGVFPEEKTLGQKFLLSAIFYTDTRMAGKTDDLSYTTDYGKVANFMSDFLRDNTYNLIECAVENLAEEILEKYPGIEKVSLEIKKPWAPIGLPLDCVSCKIERSWHEAYIALGSNMGDKNANLDLGVRSLIERKDTRVEEVSNYIITEPYGYTAQDDFLNGVMRIKTLLSPEELLEVLNEIEEKAGRERTIHWGPRTLDLDIILYEDVIMNTEELTIPHKEMHLRDFVLKPLVEIAPDAYNPVLQKTATVLLNELNK